MRLSSSEFIGNISDVKSKVIFMFIPLFIAVLLVGGDRINMISYIVFLYFSLPIKKGLNFGVIVSSVYFMVATIFFVGNILLYGDGFSVG